MKAAVLVGARDLRIKDLPDPVAPNDGIVIEVKACGICGSDLRRWSEGPPAGSGGIIPGHEVAGVVIAVGKDTAGYSPGDRLAIAPDVHCGRCYYCRHDKFNLCDDMRLIGITPGYPGGFAERLVVTGEILTNGIVHRMPEGMSFVAAALAEPCCSVLAAHDKARTSPEDTVVVLGAGPIGCLHALIAHSRGARVIVSEPSATRREMAARFRPDVLVNPSNEDVVSRVRELTGGRGADIVVCANPVAATQTQAVEMVRKAGRVVLFGGLPKSNPMVSLDANRIHYGEIEVVGSFSYHPAVHERALELICRNVISPDLLVTHTFALAQIDTAFETAAAGEGLKVVVTMEGRPE
jgi:L-iditol 2-dehydrogenase